MSDVSVEVVFNADRTRACLETPDGEFVCSRMAWAGSLDAPDSITLTPVGRTRQFIEAKMWVVLGIEPEGG